jgi:hypothetical protein
MAGVNASRHRVRVFTHEYFHGDNGAGIGASHQTGWTGAVARLIQLFGSTGPAECLHGPPLPLAHAYQPPRVSPAAAARPHRRRGPAGRGHRRLTAAAVPWLPAVAAAWQAVRAGRRMPPGTARGSP